MHRMCHRETHVPQIAQSWHEQSVSGSGAATGISVMLVRHVHPHLCCMWQAKDMKEEREGLLQDIAKLKAALQQLAARHHGMLYIHPHGQMLIHMADDDHAPTESLYHVCTAMPNLRQAGYCPHCWHALQSYHDCNCIFLGVGECCLHPNGMLLYKCCCFAPHKAAAR